MRRLVVTETLALKSLNDRLVAADSGAESSPERTAASLASLQKFNPHVVDVDQVPAGTVLLVPDDVDPRAAASQSIGGKTVAEFAGIAIDAVVAATARVRAGHEALAGERKIVLAALATREVKQQIDADADLARLVKEADAVYKDDQRKADEAQQTLKAMQDQLVQELALLEKLVG